MAGFGIPENNN